MRWTRENQVYLPDYNVARGGVYASPVKPPFDFNGSSMRIFPLRTRQNRLQAFIDSYLNFGDPNGTPAGYFRAYLPYVYLTIINYGKMSLDAANLGWVSQNEVFMNIPLMRYKWFRKELVFQDFASASPFIYVDNDLSLVAGREVYGWQKDLVSADKMTSTWATTQDEAPIVVRFSRPCSPGKLAGAGEVRRPLLQIEYTLGDPLSRFPPSPRADWLPWNILSNVFTTSGELMSDYMEILRGLRVAQRLPLVGGVPKALEQLLSIGLNKEPIVWNTLNIKQFRDAEHPSLACDQAITCAPIELQRLGGIELLGEGPLLAGDSSGGLTIDLFDYPDCPIAATLGLETSTTTKTGDATIHRIRPVFPMRFDADLRYAPGYAIAWRTKDSGWHDESNRQVGPKEPAAYNTALGAAVDEVVGPLVFPNATLRVLPLLADREKLHAFLQDYLGEPLKNGGATTDGEPVTIAPWGNQVYLVATTYDGVASETNDVGQWTERDLVFYVPARVMAGKELWKIVLVPVYAFADETTAVLTGTEVNGIPFAKATLESPTAAWLDDDGPSASTKRGLLRATTIILPAIGAGLEASERVFLEVDEGAPFPPHDRDRWRGIADGWGLRLKKELEEQRLRVGDQVSFTEGHALALQVLALNRKVHLWTLKQFPDVADSAKACYQAIVQVDREITQVDRIQEIEQNLYVRMRSYASLSIVEKLGLVTVAVEIKGSGVLEHVLQAIRPFWAKVSLKEGLGKNVFVRSHCHAWDASQSGEDDAPALTIDHIDAVTSLRLTSEPRRLRHLFFERLPMLLPRLLKPLPPGGKGVIERVTERLYPQDLLESILSEEWEAFGGCRWRHARKRLRQEYMRELNRFANEDPVKQSEDELAWFNTSISSARVDGDAPDALRATARSLLCLLFQSSLQVAYLREPTRDPAKQAQFEKVFRQGVSKLLKEDTEWLILMADLAAQMKHEAQTLDGLVEGFTKQLQSSATTIRFQTSLANRTREELILVLAKLEQKPHHFVPRDILWNDQERDRLFPRYDCRGKGWYVGRSLFDYFEELEKAAPEGPT